MDKKIFLIDKTAYRKEMVENLSEKDLEEWVAKEDYNDEYAVLKINANGYDNAEQALKEEMPFVDIEDYYVFYFGF